MKIEYSEHIKNRLKLRRIEYELPKKVFEQAEGRLRRVAVEQLDGKTGFGYKG